MLFCRPLPVLQTYCIRALGLKRDDLNVDLGKILLLHSIHNTFTVFIRQKQTDDRIQVGTDDFAPLLHATLQEVSSR